MPDKAAVAEATAAETISNNGSFNCPLVRRSQGRNEMPKFPFPRMPNTSPVLW